MTTPATRAVARAIRRSTQKHLDHAIEQPDHGIVTQVDPLLIELGQSDIVLEEDDLVLTQHVREYDTRVGFAVGDSVLVVPAASGDYAVVGVVSTSEPADAPSGYTALGTPISTAVGNIIGKLAVRDDTGAVVGYSPVYDDIT